MPAPRIILVEDDTFMRSTLKAALQFQGVEVILDTANIRAAMRFARTASPSAAVVDLDLGKGPNGIDLAIGLRNMLPNIGIVLLTGFTDPRLLNTGVAKLPAGSQYLVKHQLHEIELLFQKIEESITAANAPRTIRGKGDSLKGVDIPDAQIETLRLIAQGLLNEEIAKIRGISEKSVEQAISRLIQHFRLHEEKVNKRVELARIYFSLSGTVPGQNNEEL